jgi:hypothetical protein
MQFKTWIVPLGGLALVVLGYRSYGWSGAAGALGLLVMWMLIDFTRMMNVMRMAGKQPVGFVASAVMFNARLRKGTPLVKVIAQTRSLGIAQTPAGVEPEIFRWTDASDSYVECTFVAGRLRSWILTRPSVAD